MSRITSGMTTMQALLALTEGNPGAITVLAEGMLKYEKIDPQAVFGGLQFLLSLDTHNIYGSDIWVFYKDICNHSIATVIALLRAVQLGYLPERSLKDCIDSCSSGRGVMDYIDINLMVDRVQETLQEFNMKG